MRLHAEQGMRGRVVDLDTGLRVPKVIWLDLEKGELEAYRVDAQDRPVRTVNGDYETYTARGRFAFYPADAKEAAAQPSLQGIAMGAPRCERCGSPLTLRGKELCPRCYATDRRIKPLLLAEPLTTPLLDRRCEYKGCSRLAEWIVGDEIPTTPAKEGRYLFDRAATVGRRYCCSFHYQPPRILDEKGEIVEELENSARPA